MWALSACPYNCSRLQRDMQPNLLRSMFLTFSQRCWHMPTGLSITIGQSRATGCGQSDRIHSVFMLQRWMWPDHQRPRCDQSSWHLWIFTCQVQRLSYMQGWVLVKGNWWSDLTRGWVLVCPHQMWILHNQHRERAHEEVHNGHLWSMLLRLAW